MKLFMQRLGVAGATVLILTLVLLAVIIFAMGLMAFTDEFPKFSAWALVVLTVISMCFWLVTQGTAFINWLIIEPIKQSRKDR